MIPAAGLLRDRRDPTAPWRPRRSRRGVPHLERARTGAAARASRSCDSPRARSTRRWRGSGAPSRRRRSRCSASAGSRRRSRSRSPRAISEPRGLPRTRPSRSSTRTRSGDRRAAAFDATVHFARGQILLAEKDWDGAIAALKHARDEWQGVGAPYETARARAALGTAYRRAGDEHGSAVELESALAAFERLGAAPEAARIKELLGRVETRRTFLFTDIVDSTQAARHARRREVAAPAGTARRARARRDRRERRRGREADGRRILRVVRDPEGRGRGGGRHPARARRRRSSRRTCASARTREARSAPSESTDYGGQGVHVAARIGAAAGAGEILVSAETLDGVGAAFRSRSSNARIAERRGAAGRGRRGRLALEPAATRRPRRAGRGSATSRGRARARRGAGTRRSRADDPPSDSS